MNIIETDLNKGIDELKALLSTIQEKDFFEHILNECVNKNITNPDNAFLNAYYIAGSYIDVINDYFINVIGKNYIDEVHTDHFKKLVDVWNKGLIIIDNEFRKTVGKFDLENVPIKIYTENTTNSEKELLNHLAKNYHIKRELSQNKFPLFNKNGTKRLIMALYEYAPDYKDYNAFNFVNSCIETNLPIATLQNYCRVVKKDTDK